jgi:hypothetical protein
MDPTEELVKKEIAAARKILQEDRHAAGLNALTSRFDTHFPDNSKKDGDTGKPKPPEAVPPKEQPVRKGVWWGEPRDA